VSTEASFCLRGDANMTKDGNGRQIPAYPRAGNPMGAYTGVIPRPRVAPVTSPTGPPSPSRICLFAAAAATTSGSASSALGSSSPAVAAASCPCSAQRLRRSPSPRARPLLPVVLLTNPRRSDPVVLLSGGSSPPHLRSTSSWSASFSRAHGHDARG
jgi:hypothetical protein